MRTNSMKVICGALIALAIGTSSVWAAKPKAVPQTPLTEAGQNLETRYAQCSLDSGHNPAVFPKAQNRREHNNLCSVRNLAREAAEIAVAIIQRVKRSGQSRVLHD